MTQTNILSPFSKLHGANLSYRVGICWNKVLLHQSPWHHFKMESRHVAYQPLQQKDIQIKTIKNMYHGNPNAFCKATLQKTRITRIPTVDGRNPAPVDRQVFSIIHKALYISTGAGFLPSTVCIKW